MDQRTQTPAATTLLAIVGCGAAFTVLGPVLRPFLLAIFAFYAVQSAAKGLARLGLGLTAAYISLISLAGIAAILLGQLVYRESGVFLGKWPRYEQRIEGLIDTWPLLGGMRPAPPEPNDRPKAAADESAQAASRAEPAPAEAAREQATLQKATLDKATLEQATLQKPSGTTPPPPSSTSEPKPEAAREALAESALEAGHEAEPEADLREPVAAQQVESGTQQPAPLQPGPKAEPAGGAAKPAPPTPLAVARRSLLKDFVASGAKDLIDYVFRHSLDMAELLILVLVYTIFLSLGRHQLQARVLRAFPGDQGRRLLAIGDEIGTSMEKFMTVKTLVGAGMAASAAAILLWFRVDHWLLWTCLFFVANYVTYIGSIAACVPPIVIAFLDLPNPATASGVALLLIVNRLVWIDFVEVRLAGRELSLDPVLVFLWLAYWGWVWGILGLLLAYPMLAAVKIVLSQVEGWEGWATLMGDR